MSFMQELNGKTLKKNKVGWAPMPPPDIRRKEWENELFAYHQYTIQTHEI